MEAILLLLMSAMLFLFLVLQKRERDEASTREQWLMGSMEEQEAELVQLRQTLETEQAGKVRAQKDFIKTLSHELRIPISIIMGYSDILTNEMISDEKSQKKYLRKISEKIEGLNNLISNMVFEADRAMGLTTDEQMNKCNLSELVIGVAEDFRIVAEKKHITIEVLISEKDINIICDEVKIWQVVSNIVNNAIKYMGKPGIIQMSLGYSSSQEITMVIRDNGEGMDKSKEDTIFEESSGLGLKLCKAGIEQHKGSIWCKCAVGKGLAMYITLPVVAKNMD